ncbi:hypothetical protein EM595_p0029 (plasmid) [Duffyella gerundensis]|uniref:Uncharacterized protein n=1 Tax=Duffyella gerundensis TaxID=1619313 RepID=A0A0U5GS67_9GAMM|nr:hypothetical protein EM595_p0029 [Duffyella gerundensis]
MIKAGFVKVLRSTFFACRHAMLKVNPFYGLFYCDPVRIYAITAL